MIGEPASSVRVDPRVARTREKVLVATLDVLRRNGIHATTVDAIADAAGVARSTLYRNWESREALLDEAIGFAAVTPSVVPGDGSAIDALVELAVGVAVHLRSTAWGRTLPAIVAAIEGSEELGDRYGRFTDERRRVAVDLARRAIADGELAADADPEDVVDALVGPIFYRWLVRRRATSAAQARRIAVAALRAHGASLS